MKRLSFLILLLLVFLIPACSTTPEHYTDLESRLVEAVGSQSILIQVDHGEVTVLESEDDRVEVGGQVLFVDELEYQVSSTENQITIKVFVHRDSLSDMPLRLEVHVPKEMMVRIETENASVFVQDHQGDVEVASTSGNITIEQMTGKLTLRSNRGNVTVREGSGVINVVGNYGALTIQNVSGETVASTIIGNIVFSGLIQVGDSH